MISYLIVLDVLTSLQGSIRTAHMNCTIFDDPYFPIYLAAANAWRRVWDSTRAMPREARVFLSQGV
jgi:hypothetical protein